MPRIPDNIRQPIVLKRNVLAACLGTALVATALALPPAALATSAPEAAPHRHSAQADARSAQRARLFGPRVGERGGGGSMNAAAAGANVLPVDTCADDGSAGSLREVVAVAGDGDTIDLSALTCGTITLVDGEIGVSADNLQIVGPGRDVLSIDGDENGRVFFHEGVGRLGLSSISVVDGVLDTGSDYEGGCIFSNGDVELREVTISGCRIEDAAFGIGAGVRANGDAIVIDSTIRDTAILVDGAAGGSAIAVENNVVLMNSRISGNTVAITDVNDYAYIYFGAVNLWGELTMSGSTISNNRSFLVDPATPYSFVWGGGITTHGGGTITASTIDNNSARDLGGGVTMDGRLDLEIVSTTISGNSAHTGAGIMVRPLANSVAIRSSTIAGNLAEVGGGVYFDEPYNPLIVELQSTLIANNTATSGADIGKSDRLTIYGASNLIVDVQADIELPPDTLRFDPNLLPLADNGGATLTHALAAGSPAIDTGNDYFGLVTDQRGDDYARVSGDEADIGAFELQQLPVFGDRIFAHGLESASP